MLVAAGAPARARQAPLLVAYLDGLIFDHLAGAGALVLDRAELTAALRELLATFLSSGRRRPDGLADRPA